MITETPSTVAMTAQTLCALIENCQPDVIAQTQQLVQELGGQPFAVPGLSPGATALYVIALLLRRG